ncbi:hypothetical protein C8J42_103640 [Sphingomonas sp. PP-CE-1A-559]|nr:hypothetical protein C8J42_103640 [Sphingomonas sp. PP-CE-1A-559]
MANLILPPSLEGRGRGWVGFRIMARLRQKLADPPPTPPFQGGGSGGLYGDVANQI